MFFNFEKFTSIQTSTRMESGWTHHNRLHATFLFQVFYFPVFNYTKCTIDESKVEPKQQRQRKTKQAMEMQNKRKKSCMYMHRFIPTTFTQSGVTEIIQYRLPYFPDYKSHLNISRAS